MRSAKFLVSCWIGAAAALSPVASLAGSPGCESPEIGTSRAPRLSPPLGASVVGTGRLQFHSAPDARCPMPGTFVIPKDRVILYAQSPDSGWSFVAWLGPGSTLEPEGWVRSARLKPTGEMGHRE